MYMISSYVTNDSKQNVSNNQLLLVIESLPNNEIPDTKMGWAHHSSKSQLNLRARLFKTRLTLTHD